MELPFKISNEYDGKPRKLFEIICPCGDVKWVPKHVLSRRKFCSKECSYAKDPEKYVTLVCAACSAEFARHKNKLEKSKHDIFFCDRKCKDFGQRLESGISKIQPSHYRDGSSVYRGKIKGWKCVGCRQDIYFLLIAHHIDGDRSNNVEENIECVCHNCHTIRHLSLRDGSWVFNPSAMTPREVIPILTQQYLISAQYSNAEKTALEAVQ